MPRIARAVAVDFPHHITQRGNNRTDVFFDDEDRSFYLDTLSRYTKDHAIDILAYCLMTNHVHIIVTPHTDESLAKGIGRVSLVYTQYLNHKLRRSGRVWQNRFFSTAIQDGGYLWSAARYVERNPVKAGLSVSPEDYRWSSARSHTHGTLDKRIILTSWFTEAERPGYRDFLIHSDPDDEEILRKRTSSGRPYGSPFFVDMLEEKLGMPLRMKRRGRPKMVENDK